MSEQSDRLTLAAIQNQCILMQQIIALLTDITEKLTPPPPQKVVRRA